MDIAESGRLSKDSSPRPACTRAPQDGHGRGETSAKPVRPRERERGGCVRVNDSDRGLVVKV